MYAHTNNTQKHATNSAIYIYIYIYNTYLKQSTNNRKPNKTYIYI